MGPGGKIRGTCGGKKKGEGKSNVYPRSKAYALGKKGRASAARRKRRKDPKSQTEEEKQLTLLLKRNNENKK